MHRVAYVHRDIKLENLLFAGENCEPETLRIADFGFARKMTSSRSTLSEQCGTPGYVAPEIITGQCYTPAVDCWAAGVVLYAAVVGRFPFDAGEDTQASFRMIAEGRVHEIPASSGVSDDAKDLIARLLTVDPVTRFTAEEALGHPWIVKHTSSANDGGDGGGADGYARAVVAPGQRMRRAMQSKLGSDLKLREYPPGAYLTRLGERAKASNEEVYLIKGGVVEVLTRDDDGREVFVCERGEGDFVGQMSVLVKTTSVAEDARSTSGDGEGKEKEKEKEGAAEAEAGAKAEEAPAIETVDEDAPTPPASPTRPAGKPKVRSVGSLSKSLIATYQSKKQWIGIRRTADVRAKTDVVVAVMNGAQMRWILEHDYGAAGELLAQRKAMEGQNQDAKAAAAAGS